MERAYFVLRSRGPAWDDSNPMESQSDWAAHAAFIDGMFERRILALVGPLEGTRDALLVFRATGPEEILDHLALDPWTNSRLLVTKQISPWQIRLGTLGDQTRAGTVLYAKDVDRVVAFYCRVAGLTVGSSGKDHVVLASAAFELVVLRIPAPIADSIEIAKPPVRRESTPIKLVFFVESIAAARAAAGPLGGALGGTDQEWRFERFKVCDGHDPEGNVFQLREDLR